MLYVTLHSSGEHHQADRRNSAQLVPHTVDDPAVIEFDFRDAVVDAQVTSTVVKFHQFRSASSAEQGREGSSVDDHVEKR